MKVKLRTFPTSEGDTTVTCVVEELTKDKVFEPGMLVTMDSKAYTSWDALLADLQTPTLVEHEILRFRPVAGG